MNGFERFHHLFECGQPSTRNRDRRNRPFIEGDLRQPVVVSREVAYMDEVHGKALGPDLGSGFSLATKMKYPDVKPDPESPADRAAFQADVAVGRVGCATCKTFHFQVAAAFIAELGTIRELSVTLWTLHSSHSGRRVRLLSRGAL
jgi:hypothetical protein